MEIRKNRPLPEIGKSNRKDHLLKIREGRLLEIKEIKKNRSLPEINFGRLLNKILESHKKDHLLNIIDGRLLEIKEIRKNRPLPEIGKSNKEDHPQKIRRGCFLEITKNHDGKESCIPNLRHAPYPSQDFRRTNHQPIRV